MMRFPVLGAFFICFRPRPVSKGEANRAGARLSEGGLVPTPFDFLVFLCKSRQVLNLLILFSITLKKHAGGSL